MDSRRSTRLFALSAALAVAAGLGAAAYFAFVPRDGDPFADCRSSTVAGGVATIGGPFSLTDGDGRRVTDKDVLTGPTLDYFGYSFCPDFCPTDLARNALVADELASREVRVGQVFITIDPARDTPPVVRDFAAAIHPDLVGLTGTPEEIAAAAAAFRVYYRKADTTDYYMMDHSTFTYLVDPAHGFLEFYGSNATPDEMATSVACYASRL